MFRGPTEQIVNLFRDGCFATVDEFSFLAGNQFQAEVQALKARVRFALALHNPEDASDKSDYYPFIQRLFKRGIFPLRNDVAILTFNYDPYLPFLLRRAVRVRSKAAGQADTAHWEHAVTSGFAGRRLDALADGDGLCLLHLHGMIAWPDRSHEERVVAFEDLFTRDAKRRWERLHSNVAPPIVFPWEVINEKGRFRSKAEFCLEEPCDETHKRQGCYSGPHDLHDLFTSIWKRARKEISLATKISFVGLSMHEFLNPAFKFLFSQKRNDAEIVIANKDLEKFKAPDQATNNPRSPVFKVKHLLKDIWRRPTDRKDSTGSVPMQTRETFGEFIQYEMD